MGGQTQKKQENCDLQNAMKAALTPLLEAYQKTHFVHFEGKNTYI